MKTIILAALLAVSTVATGAPAFGDNSLTVHGVFGGNSYGR
jgi:hypothetical protein